MVVVGNIKISRSFLVYVPIKKFFPPKQSGFSLRLGIGGTVKNHAAKQSLQRPINNQILDYRAVLEVCQEEMKSIIFFGIDKEDMTEVREDGEEVRRW